jgi:23S rRNA G2445 N2-methylase RlmL
VFFVVAFGAQTDEIFVGIRQLREKFGRFFVVNMSGSGTFPVPLALLAPEAVAPENLDPFSMLWMHPSGICVVKSHTQNKKSLNHAQRCCHGLGSKASIGY